ncbi:MAG: ABC transporter permease [Lachnospiraceae bacterium]|jgi:ribose/xylose/arabinose/galactoside ABC-type transport system permease subunit
MKTKNFEVGIKQKQKAGLFSRVPEAGVFLVLVILVVLFSFVANNFFTTGNFINIARQITEVSIAAIGMTFVIITGEIDLSPGAIYGLAAAMCAYMLHKGMPAIFAVIITLVICACAGLISGLFVTRMRLPAFIITLCVQMVARGVIYIITGGASISRFPTTDNWFFALGGKIGGVFPIQIFLMIVLVVIFAIILKHTRFGFKIYAVGGNIRAAEVSGINVKRTKLIAFILSSTLAAVSGLISLAYLKSLYPTAGSGKEMDIVAACILGGTSMAGGSGTIIGTLIGAAIIGVIRNALVLLGVDTYYQEATVGLVILFGVCIDVILKRRNASRQS